MSDPEIILNLWYVVDDLGYIYSLRARAYLGSGSDDEKLAMLQKYAKTDYLIAKAFPIPKQFHINGQPILQIGIGYACRAKRTCSKRCSNP